MNSIRTLSVLAAFLALSVTSFPSLAAARTDAEIEVLAMDALNQRHPNTSAEWWVSLGPNTPAVLMKIYRANSDRIQVRSMVLGALAAFPGDPTVTDFLRQELSGTDASVLREQATRALGLVGGAGDVSALEAQLSDARPNTRLVTALALDAMGRRGVPRALEATNAWRAKESLPWVREKFDAAPRAEPARMQAKEERLDARWEGRFRGLWLLSQTAKPGLQSKDLEWVGKFTSSEQTRVSFQVESSDKVLEKSLRKFEASGRARELRTAGSAIALQLELRPVGSDFWIFATALDGTAVGVLKPDKSSLMRSAKTQ